MISTGGIFGGKHTYNDFHMVPKTNVEFAPPAPKTSKIDVPYADGEIDYTEIINGFVYYGNRKGTLDFLVIRPLGVSWPNVYSNILKHFNGVSMRIILDNDQSYFYNGRVRVSKWKSKDRFADMSLDYDLEPYKYPIQATDIPPSSSDWWKGSAYQNIRSSLVLDVNFSESVTINNASAGDIRPVITCSAPMTVSLNDVSYQLMVGENENSGVILAHGNNTLTFYGAGRVSIDYSGGRTL